MNSRNIILVDDADNILNLLSKRIQSFECHLFKLKYQAASASDIMNFSPFLVIVYAAYGSEEAALELLARLKNAADTAVIIIFETENELLINRALLKEADGIFIMPVFEAELTASIKTILRQKELEIKLNSSLGGGHLPDEEIKKEIEKEKDRFGSLFDDSPIPICDEDYSEVKKYFMNLKKEGVTDFRTYFHANPEEAKKCSSLIKVNNINKEALKFLNGPADKSNESKFYSMMVPESYEVFKEIIISLAEGKTNFESEILLRGINGETKAIIIKIKIPPGFEKNLKQVLITFFDISERKLAEERIRASLKEKEILLKEIHHRVKNNLQIISSLLNLQSEYITDKTSKDLFYDSLNRIRSMALIHERLYQSKNFSRINVPDYIKDVTNYLLRTYKSNLRDVRINSEVENLSISIEVAIPLGLLINELVSNSLKYAFNGKSYGLIDVKMKNTGGGYELILMDNGVGIPDYIDFKNTKSLGLQLVNNLVEQLEGTIELDKSRGTCFIIKFNINEK